MVKNTLKKMETPELDKLTSNKRKKISQRRENTAASVNAIATTTTTKRVNKTANAKNKEVEDLIMQKLRFGSAAQDDDDDDDDDYDFEEDDEEAEESETDLLDEDGDEEASLLISSDEEEFLETQRISLPELIVKKLLQTTTTTTTTAAVTERNAAIVLKTKKSNELEAPPMVSSQKEEQEDNSTIKNEGIGPYIKPKIEQIDEVPTETESSEVKINDFHRPMLLPKLEKIDGEFKQKTPAPLMPEVTKPAIICLSKRRRGRPPKSKLTEANVQLEATGDKSSKQHRTTISPTSSTNVKDAVFGHIGYFEPEKSLVYQCTLCNLLLFNEFRTYAQHLHTTHHVLNYIDDPIMVIIPQRKIVRTQQSGQQKAISTIDIHEHATRMDLKREPSEMNDQEQPKDDKENIIFQLNKRNIEQLSKEPYFACGLVTLYDGVTLNLICKFCDCVHIQEELFKKHLLLEHQALMTSINANEKVDTPTSAKTGNHDVVERTINALSKTGLKSNEMLSPNKSVEICCELLTTAQAPETPPPEEEELEKDKENYDNVGEGIIIRETTLPHAIVRDAQQTANGTDTFTKGKHHDNSRGEVLSVDNQKIIAKGLDVKECPVLFDDATNALVDATNPAKEPYAIPPVVEEQPVGVRAPINKEVLEEHQIETITHMDEHQVVAAKDQMPFVETLTKKPKGRPRKRKKDQNNTELLTKPKTKCPTTRGRQRRSQATRENKTEQSEVKFKKTSTTEDGTKPQDKIETESIIMNVESTLSLPTKDNTELITINNEITTTALPTHTQRKRRNARNDSKQLSPSKKEKTHINPSASTQVHEQQHEIQKSETTPSTPLPSESSISKNPTKKRKRNVNTTLTQMQNAQATSEIAAEVAVQVSETATIQTELKKIEEENVKTKTKKTENDNENTEEEHMDRALRKFFKKRKEKADIVCEICKKTFKKSSRLLEHIRLHTGEKPFKCEKCGKKFRIKARLTDHMLRHLGTRKFKCNICDLALSTRQDLSQHQRHHTGVRPHVCTYCPKAFVRSSDLKIHLRVHTGEKPYVCDICNQSFRANQNLYIHKKSHFGVKDYKCDCCDKAFMRKIDQRMHMRTHTGEKPYKCEICGRGFSSKHNVRAHIERLHVENAGSGGTAPKRGGGFKPNALRAELERQKGLIEELRNQLAQHIKTEEVMMQQQQQRHCVCSYQKPG